MRLIRARPRLFTSHGSAWQQSGCCSQPRLKLFLENIIARLMKMLLKNGYLTEMVRACPIKKRSLKARFLTAVKNNLR